MDDAAFKRDRLIEAAKRLGVRVAELKALEKARAERAEHVAPEGQVPEAAGRVSRTGGDRDRAFELVGPGIESVDFAVQVAEITDQKVANLVRACHSR